MRGGRGKGVCRTLDLGEMRGDPQAVSQWPGVAVSSPIWQIPRWGRFTLRFCRNSYRVDLLISWSV